jgi:ATP-dependent helicase/nuclease subunit A
MKPTPSQTKALSTARHLAITANAGSGKTRVLVTRYVNLFEQYPDLTTRNVAAITFTENAASELRERIIKEISDRLSDATNTDSNKRARVRALRDSLPSAFIGTIHGFASRLLRAYPVEANIDASFAIVTGADQRLLVEDAIGRVFYSALEESYEQPEENPTLHLFRTLGRQTVTNLVRALLNNRMRATTVRNDLLSKTNAEILSLWRREFEDILQIATSKETREILKNVRSYLKSGKTASDALEAIQAYLLTSEFFESASAFAAVSKRLIVKEGTLRKNVIDEKTAPRSILAEMEEWIERVLPIRSLLNNCPKSENEYVESHQEYLDLLRAVFDLDEEVRTTYRSTKTEYGLLDFDDLIGKLIQLLDNPQVREEISREFRFVMIDEYQDTDEGQFKLATQLTNNFGPANNIAIVGDPKQAIYTFRNADAEVFNQTREAITSQSLSEASRDESIALSLSPDEERGSIVLAESFRMTRTPLAAINLLFRTLLAEEKAKYSELIHGRGTGIEGKVEWICPQAPLKNRNSEPNENNEEEEDARSNFDEEEYPNETDLIATKILSIIQNNDPAYRIEKDKVLQKPSYDDIAILLRSRGSLRSLERSLNAAHIPYVVSKGSGFYSQPEILDIISYLKFLASPTNDVALAAILRSPFFAVSDVEFFQIAHHESAKRRSVLESWTFWQQFQSYTSTKQDTHLSRAAGQLNENLALAGRTSTALLVEKIYTETGIFASLQGGPQPAQKIANLEKFLSQARAVDQSGFSGLLDFVDRIQYLADSEEQESQADISTDRGAVRIMTIHAAKGLEFPIVILPFLQKKFNFDHQHLLDKELGLQIRFPVGNPQPLIAELIHERSKASTVAEEKRILYVAMTRARDHLILSCTLPEKPKQDSWLAWICKTFGVPDSGDALHLTDLVSRYDPSTQKVNTEPFQFQIPLLRSASDIAVSPKQEDRSPLPAIPPFFLDTLEAQHPHGRFSATQLLRFKECPTKYHLSYVLGMPEEPKLAYDLEPDEYSETVRGPLLGQIVHRLMEKIDRLAPSGSIEKPSIDEVLQSIFDSLEMANQKDRSTFATAALQHVSSFLKSPIAIEMRSGTNTRTEFALQALLPSGDTLYGIIDRLYQDQTGTWTILDYKTEAKPNDNSFARYRFQLQFYAYLVHLMYPSAEQIRCILFFTTTGDTTEFQFSSSDFSQFTDECSSVIKQIREQEHISDLRLLPRNLDHCPECRFFDQPMDQCMVLASDVQNPTAIPAI